MATLAVALILTDSCSCHNLGNCPLYASFAKLVVRSQITKKEVVAFYVRSFIDAVVIYSISNHCAKRKNYRVSGFYLFKTDGSMLQVNRINRQSGNI